MISILEVTNQIGGMIGRSMTSVVAPIPGSGVVLAPIGSKIGEKIGEVLPQIDKKDIPNAMKDSVKIYQSGGKKNFSLKVKDQINLRKTYVKKAKDLGYNKIGQTISVVDPTILSIIPNSIIKKNK